MYQTSWTKIAKYPELIKFPIENYETCFKSSLHQSFEQQINWSRQLIQKAKQP